MTAVLLALIMAASIMGCMEEGAEEADGNPDGDQNPQDAGGDEGKVYKALDVEVTNIEWTWSGPPGDSLTDPDLTVRCDAINYGGAGRITVVITASAGDASESENISVTVEKLVTIDGNVQLPLEFHGKLAVRPVNISWYTKRALSEAVVTPRTEEMDVEVCNVYYDSLTWLDENQTQLEAAVHVTVINYDAPGYVTVVAEMTSQDMVKKLEERVRVGFYEQVELRLISVLPYPPSNITVYIKRPQPG